jgi:hypothetical protein
MLYSNFIIARDKKVRITFGLIMTSSILPSNPTERYLPPILLIMFVVGIALACGEVVSWWKARMAQYREPPFTKLVTYVQDSDGRWHATHLLWFSLQPRPVFPEPLKPPVQSVQEDRLKKAA